MVKTRGNGTTRFRLADHLWFLACTAIVTIDGFDVAAVGFALPYLPASFLSDPALKGVLLSSGIAGMAAGAIVIAPLADRFGRVVTIRSCLIAAAAAMALSGLAPTAGVLLALRLLTGVAIGGMTASLMVLVQEYARPRIRGLVFGLYSLGFPLGSTLGGGVGALLLDSGSADWRVMFFVGAALGALGALLAFLWLPAEGAHGTAGPSAAKPRLPVSVLFRDGAGARTFALWGTYGLLMVAYYFISSWTPQLVADATGQPQSGTAAGFVLSIGTFLGALAFALGSLRYSTALLVGVSMAFAGVAVLALWPLFGTSGVALVVIALLGVAIYIAITGAGALVVPLYPAEIRATAGGWMVGIGRMLSIASPLLAGALSGLLPPATVYALAAVPLLIGAALVPALRLRPRAERS